MRKYVQTLKNNRPTNRGRRAILLALTVAVSTLTLSSGRADASGTKEQRLTFEAVLTGHSVRKISWAAPTVTSMTGEAAVAAGELLENLSASVSDDAVGVFPDGRTLPIGSQMSNAENWFEVSKREGGLVTLEVRMFQKKKSSRCGIGFDGNVSCLGKKAWSFGSSRYNAVEVTRVVFHGGNCLANVMKASGWRIPFYVCRTPAADGTTTWEVISADIYPDVNVVKALVGAQTRIRRAAGMLTNGSTPVSHGPDKRLRFSTSSYSPWTDQTESVTVEIYFKHPAEKKGAKWYQVMKNVPI